MKVIKKIKRGYFLDNLYIQIVKKTPHFYFLNNFYKFLYFFTKFGIQVAKRFLHMYGKFHDYSTSIGGVISI